MADAEGKMPQVPQKDWGGGAIDGSGDGGGVFVGRDCLCEAAN